MPCDSCRVHEDRVRFLEQSNEALRARAHRAESDAERLREMAAFQQQELDALVRRGPRPARAPAAAAPTPHDGGGGPGHD